MSFTTSHTEVKTKLQAWNIFHNIYCYSYNIHNFVALAFIIMISLNVPSFITRLSLGRQFTTYDLLVLHFIKIYSMPGIFHACNYCSSIFSKEVNDVIASSTEVSDDPVAGGGRYFYILVVERHLTEPISCFSSSKSEMFDYNLPTT